MKKTSLVGLCLVFLFLFTANAQQNPPSNTGLFGGLQNMFDLRDTNSLVNANEINVSTFYKRDSKAQLNGGALKLDWWVTDQQGAFFGFEEYGDRSAYFTLGYQARTVFKQMELSIGLGTRQNNDDPFGDVLMFLSPALTYRIVHSENWDVRITAGADIIATGRPNPYIGFTIRATRF
jgi:hypothetical protein